MKWKNLLENKCPKCSSDIHAIAGGEVIGCDDLECGFSISTPRYQEIVRQRVERTLNQWGEPEAVNPDVGDIFE